MSLQRFFCSVLVWTIFGNCSRSSSLRFCEVDPGSVACLGLTVGLYEQLGHLLLVIQLAVKEGVLLQKL